MIKSLEITKERKVILIIGAVLLILGAVYRFYPDIHDFFSKTDEIEFTKKNIEKYLDVVAKRKGLERRKNLLKRDLKRMEAGRLTGNTPALAAVEIQGIISDITHSNGVKMQTMQVMQPKQAEKLDYITIPVRFSFTSNILQLKQILYKIESPPKLLIITDLNVETYERGGKGVLRSTMTVAGIMKSGQKKGYSSPKKIN